MNLRVVHVLFKRRGVIPNSEVVVDAEIRSYKFHFDCGVFVSLRPTYSPKIRFLLPRGGPAIVY